MYHMLSHTVWVAQRRIAWRSEKERSHHSQLHWNYRMGLHIDVAQPIIQLTWQQCSWWDEMVGKLIAHREQIFMDQSQHLVGISSNAIITWLRRMESLWTTFQGHSFSGKWFNCEGEEKWTYKSIFGFEECRKDDLVNWHVTWVKAQIHLFADSLIIWDWHYQDKAKPSGKGMRASFLHTWTMDEAMLALNNRLIWGTIWSE